MNETELAARVGRNDFSPLPTHDERERYFQHLLRVVKVLGNLYEKRVGVDHIESKVVTAFLQRLLVSVRAIQYKYAFDDDRVLRVDLTESGFPNNRELLSMVVDFNNREEQLAGLSESRLLKEGILDYLFGKGTEPRSLLRKLARRMYLELLSDDTCFFPFTPGPIVREEQLSNGHPAYRCSWACYDPGTNRPYIYLMMFEYSGDSDSFENDAEEQRIFFRALRAEGSRAPGLAIVATGIDRASKTIHPKVLKRICIGPICSAQFSRDPVDLCAVLEEHSEENDFIVFLDEEIIFSERQEVSQSFFSEDQIREVFYIPRFDPEISERHVSVVHRHVVLPHNVLQHLVGTKAYEPYRDVKAITFDKKGVIYDGSVSYAD